MKLIALKCMWLNRLLITTGLFNLFVFYCEGQEGLELGRILQKEMHPLLKESKIILNVRPRYETADQDGRDDSNAVTLRTRLGFKTGSFNGISALIEMEDIRVIGSEGNFNPYPQPGRTVIADPEGTELNRAQVSITGFDTTTIIGRQRIILDNARFIGNVGFRQNEQTYDAVTVTNQSIPDFIFYYGYIDTVHRIFGDDAPQPAQREFKSSSHLIKMDYKGQKSTKLTLYAYLLDLNNAAANSSNTYGMQYSGSRKSENEMILKWHVEFAHQTDANNNPSNYEANYFHVTASTYKCFTLGAGYELFGSDNNQGFRTPLATLHKFNGWSDVFLSTPSQGLEDIYLMAGISLMKDLPAKITGHWFTAEEGSQDYGYEIDAVISRKMNKHWSILAKYSYFNGENGFADRQKFWLQTDIKF